MEKFQRKYLPVHLSMVLSGIVCWESDGLFPDQQTEILQTLCTVETHQQIMLNMSSLGIESLSLNSE